METDPNFSEWIPIIGHPVCTCTHLTHILQGYIAGNHTIDPVLVEEFYRAWLI